MTKKRSKSASVAIPSSNPEEAGTAPTHQISLGTWRDEVQSALCKTCRNWINVGLFNQECRGRGK